MRRDQALAAIASATAPFDIAIIGGGASGLGAAVDAAARGHSVALFEQSDFAKGTSSRSTKLIHGGVRYLRQGNLPLVREALRERARLAANAPHLVHARPFVIPAYRRWETPYYGAGLKVYDRLAGGAGLAPSRILGRRATLDALPNLAPGRLRGGVRYYDGQFDDARLAVNLAQTAADHGATLANYCECVRLHREKGRVRGVVVRDREDATEHTVRARVVLNATGVFADTVCRMEDPAAPPLLTVSQGIHLVLPKRFLPGEAAMMIPKTADGRVLFAVPWHDRVVVGTTDTPVDGPALEPRALSEERDFVFEHARKYLDEGPAEADVCSVYAGLRPLVRAGGGKSTAALSRGHGIRVSAGGLVTLTGGKWTTYRKMGEDAVDRAQAVAGLPRYACPTADLRLRGHAAEAPEDPVLAPYGADASGIAELERAEPDLRAPCHPAFPIRRSEVIWHARHEMARTVEDVLARRSRCLILDAAASIEAAPVVADLLARELGRDDAWIATQTAAYTETAKGYRFADPASTAEPDG